MAEEDIKPFPTDPAEFLDDERVSQSQVSGLYILEDENGQEYEWIANRWAKTMDEELLKQHAEGYKVAGVDEDEPAVNMTEKRKQAKARAKAAKEQAKEKPKRENTAIYVTGLPENASLAAIKGFFSGFGMIAESVDTGKQRVKLYYDDDGNFKGEALIVFQYPTSVVQAINMYDDAPFPTAQVPSSSAKMRIVAADESYKKLKDEDEGEKKAETESRSAHVFSKEDRAKAKRKREEMDKRLADWGDEDPSAIDVDPDRWYDRVVVVKHFFNRESMDRDIKAGYASDAADYVQQIYDDMVEEAEKFGGLESVEVYDQEEPGIVTIEFRDVDTAKTCIKKFDGRAFDGRRLQAHISDGTEMFRKSKKRKTSTGDENRRT